MKTNCCLFLIIIPLIVIGQRTISQQEASSQFISNGQLASDVTAVLDTNGFFDKFLGTWQGSNNGKIVTVFIYKDIKSYQFITYESLYIKQIVEDQNGTILYSDMNDETASIFSNFVVDDEILNSFIEKTPCTLQMKVILSHSMDIVTREELLKMDFLEIPGVIDMDECPNGLTPNVHSDGASIFLSRI